MILYLIGSNFIFIIPIILMSVYILFNAVSKKKISELEYYSILNNKKHHRLSRNHKIFGCFDPSTY